MFLLSLFIGPFLDSYKNGTIFLLMITVFGDVFVSVASMINSFDFNLSIISLILNLILIELINFLFPD